MIMFHTYQRPMETGYRYAIIAFLLLSVDEEMGIEGLKKFSDFMGLVETEADGNGNETDDRFAKLRAERDKIIHEGNAFLENHDGDDVRYDCVTEALDHVMEKRIIPIPWWRRLFNPLCGLGTAAMYRGATTYRKLEGSACRLFGYLKLVVFDCDYGGNKKRFLKYLAKKWGIDKSVLPTLETFAKSLDEINLRRVEIRDSDMPHCEAVTILADLDVREKTIWKELNRL